MNISSILFTILIRPLEVLYEVIFAFVYFKSSHNILLTLIILSFVVNILVLPLYYRADIIQREENEKRKSIKKWESHIKKAFKGDEQFMMLQTYYRQNDYKPYQTLNNAIPLLLEIPFFIAAYHFLSNINVLVGIELWQIKDLSAPDGLLSISGVSINVLPILMTIINIISLEVYSHEIGLKKKIQMYVMAIFFLMLLYNSPAVLCMYWTLNNIFSLIKNIVYKIVYLIKKDSNETKQVSMVQDKKGSLDSKNINNLGLFMLAATLIIIFAGLYIPSRVIASSPEDFFEKSLVNNPVNYIYYDILMFIGIFICWGGILYYLSNKKSRFYLVEIIVMISFISIFNYAIMDDQGMMSKYFTYVSFTSPSIVLIIQNIVFIIGIAVLVHIINIKWKTLFFYVISLAICTFTTIGIKNINKINTAFSKKQKIVKEYSDDAEIHLSKSGKNVVVIMMDQMVSQYIPYFLNEKPELFSEFSGFTYYPNTISFGAATISGSPGLYGGYEYIPQESSKKTNVLLKDKQNEALKVMPVMFNNNGYKVRVSDPTYANYDWIPDLSIFDAYPDIVTSISIGQMNDENERYNVPQMSQRNIFFNSILNISPVFLKGLIYQKGNYYNPNRNYGISYQEVINKHMSAGINDDFYDSYCVLNHLDDITIIDEDGGNNFYMMSNDTTHSPCLLQEPDYEPGIGVDNTKYDEQNSVRYDVYGNELNIFKENGEENDLSRVKDYQVGMAAMIKLGEWMEYLQNNGVYDNTRIIIVSDHSSDEMLNDDFNYILFNDDYTKVMADMFRFQSTLLVKDFDSKDFMICEDFMTNADVPALAINGLLNDNKNPFTGNEISTEYKNNNELQLNFTTNWSTENNNGYTLLPEHWFTVHDNIFDKNNWSYLGYY